MFLRRLAGPLLAGVKESTGLVGLEVVPNAREVLIGLYKQTLEAVQVIPDTAMYRKSVEEFTNFRLKVCEEEEDWQKIEERIRDGQVEELIETAKNELELIPRLAGTSCTPLTKVFTSHHSFQCLQIRLSTYVLLATLAVSKPWDVPEGYKVEIIEDKDQVPDHVPIHRSK